MFIAFVWFVGELFDRGVWCQFEGAGAHEINMGVGVVGGACGVEVEVSASGAGDGGRFVGGLHGELRIET